MFSCSVTKLLLAAILLLCSQGKAAVSAGGNAREHAAMCELMQLATGVPDLLDPVPSTKAATDAVMDMNMSLADADWQKMFVGAKNDSVAWDPKLVTDQKYPPHWEKSWASWSAAAERIRSDNNVKEALKANGFSDMDDASRQLARQHMQPIAAAVAEITQQATTIAETIEGNNKATITKLLNSAAYGTDNGKGVFDTSASTGQAGVTAGACDSGAALNSKETICYTLLCLYSTASGGAQTKGCITTTDITSNWTTNSGAMVTTGLKNILATCSLNVDHKTTYSQLEAALSKVKSLIKRSTNTGILGHKEGANCNGSSASGMCVTYKDYVTAEKDNFAKIHWAQKLQAAATAIRAHNTVVQELKSVASAAATAEKQAALIARHAKEIQKITTATNNKASAEAHKSIKATEDKQKLCAAHHASQTDCDAKEFCSYDKTKDKGKRCVYNETKAEKSGVPVAQAQIEETSTA
uniref:Variant surface glycoprotein 1125.4733 n=1 Tax=Trypanosoma brucei TaxID=5691 RepID=A0A1J0RB44_9TRYP|nr:variant surface glycoprotein 1125.4733 [Trypanosoma brucei]